MTDQQIQKSLKNLGKGCFVQHYEMFASQDIEFNEKVQTLVKAHGYTEKSCASRVKKAQFIIADGFGPKALTMITKSEVSIEISNKAKELLAKFPAK